VSPKDDEKRTYFPTVSEFAKSDIKFYKKYNVEPPIDMRSNSRRYRDALQTRIKKRSSIKERLISRENS
jgi:hypothetical protein